MERGGGIGQRIVKLEPRPRYARVAPAVATAPIRGETRRVLIALGIFVNANGQCWPKNSLISASSGVDLTHIPRALRDAADKGLLRIERRSDGSNLYTLIGLAAEPPVASGEATGGYAPAPPVVIDVATSGYAPYIEEHPNEHPNEAAHSTARARGRESAVEILPPIEVERSDQFELLWLEYPTRPDDPKQLARQAFDKLVSSGVNPEKLIAAAVRYAEWVKRDAPGGAYVSHMHRWLREGRYQQEHKAWPQPRGGIIGAAHEALREPLLPDHRHQHDDHKRFTSWIDRLDELERTATWCADWGPPPNDPACQMPPRFRGKPCVRRWLEHAANVRDAATE